MSYWCLQFPPKNERKQVNMRFHSRKVEFIHSYLGGNFGLKKSFRLCLTFRTYFLKSIPDIRVPIRGIDFYLGKSKHTILNCNFEFLNFLLEIGLNIQVNLCQKLLFLQSMGGTCCV